MDFVVVEIFLPGQSGPAKTFGAGPGLADATAAVCISVGIISLGRIEIIVIEISVFGRCTRLVALLTILNHVLTIAASMVACWMQGENASLEMCALVSLCNVLHSY